MALVERTARRTRHTNRQRDQVPDPVMGSRRLSQMSDELIRESLRERRRGSQRHEDRQESSLVDQQCDRWLPKDRCGIPVPSIVDGSPTGSMSDSFTRLSSFFVAWIVYWP